MSITYADTLDNTRSCDSCGRSYYQCSIIKVAPKTSKDAPPADRYEEHHRPICNPCIREQGREEEFNLPTGRYDRKS